MIALLRNSLIEKLIKSNIYFLYYSNFIIKFLVSSCFHWRMIGKVLKKSKIVQTKKLYILVLSGENLIYFL